jgi:hypothetical protein
MALDSTGLFTVIGKYVKAINVWNGYISTMETLKDEIFDKLEDESLQDLYVDLPSQFLGFKTAVGSWIDSLIGEVEDILLDEDYVTDELPIFQRDVTTVLNAIYDYMVDNSLTIESSVVSLAASDTDKSSFAINSSTGGGYSGFNHGRVFITRKLDGLSDPSSTVTAHQRYANAEGQLSMSATHLARVISNSEGAEVVQLFSEVDAQAPYGPTVEKPGNGPTVVNAMSSNIIPANHDFSLWSSATPNSWTMAGGVETTDWARSVATADRHDALVIKTDEVTAKQQLTGLVRYQMYFFGVIGFAGFADGTDTATFVTTVETVAGSAYDTSNSLVFEDNYIPGLTDVGTDKWGFMYGFFCPGEDDDLNDFYLKIRMSAQTDPDMHGYIYETVVAPVTYYNGIAHAYWSPVNTPDTNDYGSIAIANNNNGVFQTFFRRAFDIQLPTADSPTIDDALAV